MSKNRDIAERVARFVIEIGIAASVLISAASCSSPSSPPADDAAMGSKARLCRISRLMKGMNGQFVVSMMVLNDGGWCGGWASGRAGIGMSLQGGPQHGRVQIAGESTAQPHYYYYPEPGFTGLDRFTLFTGGNHLAVNFEVRVVR